MSVERRYIKVEMGSKNHEVVPVVLIVQISGLRNGGVNKILGSLAKRNLVAKVQNSRCTLLNNFLISHTNASQTMDTD